MLKLIIISIVLVGLINHHEGCIVPIPKTTTTTTTKAPSFSYSSELIKGKFDLLYNDVVLGVISARIVASPSCKVVGLSNYQCNGLKTALTHDGSEPRVTGDGFRFTRFEKTGTNYVVDFYFNVCIQGKGKVDFGNSFSPICAENGPTHESVFPTFTDVPSLSTIVSNHTC